MMNEYGKAQELQGQRVRVRFGRQMAAGRVIGMAEDLQGCGGVRIAVDVDEIGDDYMDSVVTCPILIYPRVTTVEVIK